MFKQALLWNFVWARLAIGVANTVIVRESETTSYSEAGGKGVVVKLVAVKHIYVGRF